MSSRGFQRHTPAAVTRTYHALLALWNEQGYAPSIKEIAARTNHSLSGVFRHLDHLEAWGYLHRPPNTARVILLANPEHLKQPPATCSPHYTGRTAL